MSDAAPAAAAAATMQAVVQSGYGDTNDVLTFSSSYPAPPAPSSQQVQVRVHAASINPADTKILHGNLKLVVRLSLPHVPGMDLSGVVTAVGGAVTRLKVGDAILAQNPALAGGAFGELVNVQEELVSLKPDKLSFAEAAAVPLAAMTALSMLDKAALAQGEKVVVIGAAGGVGSFAVQMAKLLGASHVAAVSSDKNASYVRSLGADSVVDYKSKKLSEAVEKEYDVVLDCVGGREQWEEAQKVLKVSGRFVTIVGDDRETKVTVGSVLATGSSMVGRKLSGLFSSQHHQYFLHAMAPSAKLLDRVVEWLKDDKLNIHLDRRFDFSEQGVKDMCAYSESGRTVGKVVMEIIKEGDDKAQQSAASSAPAASTSATTATTSETVTSADNVTEAAEPAAASSSTSAAITTTVISNTDSSSSSSSGEASVPAANSTVASVTVAGGGTGGSIQGTVGDQPTAPHTDVSTGSIE